MDKVESDPIIHDKSDFERWLRDEEELKESTIRTYVTDLKRISRELRIEIGPETVGSRDDADEWAKKHKREHDSKGPGYRTAARRYADFVQASKSA